MSMQPPYPQEQIASRTDDGRRPRIAGVSAPAAHFAAIAAACIATILAWQIVATGFSARYANTDPAAALALKERDGDALLAIARARMTGPDGQPVAPPPSTLYALRDAAREALAEAPLDVRMLRLLAALEEQAGNAEAASRLMTEAGARSVRDTTANIWLLQQAVKRQDYALALRHMDMVSRTSPQMRDQLLPILTAIAEDPQASRQLFDLLASGPPWRSWFLVRLPGGVKDLLALQPRYLDLMSAAVPLQPDELGPFLRRLIASGFAQQAYYTWVQSLSPDERRALTYVYNGDFQRPRTNLVFDWTIMPISGASIAFEPESSNPSNQVLRIEFIRKRTMFRNVTQLILLGPGSYTLTGRYKAYDLLARRGLLWRIYCSRGPKGIVGESTRIRGTEEEWKPLEAKFVIPEEGCDTQVLRLEIDARADVEAEMSGSVWFDDLKITQDSVATNSTSAQEPQPDGEQAPMQPEGMIQTTPQAQEAPQTP